jgi:hypothetical protein
MCHFFNTFPSLISFAESASVITSFGDDTPYGLSIDFYFIVLVYFISFFCVKL